MLLDLDDPSQVLGHTQPPLWEPDAQYELSSFVPRVVFPTGIVLRGNNVNIYYGAADTHTAVAELALEELIPCCIV